MTSPYAALAAAKYLAVEQARRRLARQETELHQMVAKLSPEAFTEYADITTDMDDKQAARERALDRG